MAKGTGSVIFLTIIAVAGLGLSGYMFVSDFLSKDEVEVQPNMRLVALWNNLAKNKINNPSHGSDSDFLLEFSNITYLDLTYVNVINSTRFTFSIAGLYKINFNVILSDLQPSNTYWLILLRNITIIEYMARFTTDNPIVDPFQFTPSSVYINSTSANDYYEINVYGTSILNVDLTQTFNQLSIEYVIV